MGVGIEAINVYAARMSLDVRQLFQQRGLDMQRFGDPVTDAVNPAKPMVGALSPAGRARIELLIAGTESASTTTQELFDT
ncbi:MAG TPA: hypothetical protein VFA20_33315 [Myxococcaceae bacterium]|nr:hypothetical protein [Myxococcaceae bacterium]